MTYISNANVKVFIYFVPDEFNLLGEANTKNLITIDVDYVMGDEEFEITFKRDVTIPIHKLKLYDATLSSPFLLRTTFKLREKFSTTCMFSLVDTSSTDFELCFTPIGDDTTVVTVISDNIPGGKLEISTAENFTLWTELLIHIEEETATFYVNCKDMGNENGETITYIDHSSPTDIRFSKTSELHLRNFQVSLISYFYLLTVSISTRLCLVHKLDRPKFDRLISALPISAKIGRNFVAPNYAAGF